MKPVRAVSLVSDGIVVDFLNGIQCYYPASFLLEQLHTKGNQVLLDYDPSPDCSVPHRFTGFEEHRSADSLAV